MPTRRSNHARGWLSVAVALPALLVVAGISMGACSNSASVVPHSASAHAASPPRRATTPTGPTTPSAKELSPGCQLTSPSTQIGPTSSVPTPAIRSTIRPPGGVWTFSVTGGRIYVVNGNGLYVYGLGGSQLHAFALPSSIVGAKSGGAPVGDDEISQPIVDPSGDVFVSSYYGQAVVELGPTGHVSHTLDPGGGNPTNIFALSSSKGAWEVGITTAQRAKGSYVYNEKGTAAGSASLSARSSGFSNPGQHADVLYTTGLGLVQTWNPTATKMLAQFGSSSIHGTDYHTGGPLSFYYPDQAVMVGGLVYAADGLGTLAVTEPNGLLVGATTLGTALGTGVDLTGDLGAANGDLFAATGAPFDPSTGTISVIPIATVDKYLSVPQSPLNVLGWGAGLNTGVAGNYFAPGVTPAISADFAPWWTSLSSHLELTYQIWNGAAIRAERPPASTTVHLPRRAKALARIPVALPASDREPGPYEVEAKLYNAATSPPTRLGAVCMTYTVGAPGDRLDLGTLPGGTSSGGPTDDRGVVLNSELGLSGLRALQGEDWSSLLPNCNASAPTPTTCGAAALTFAGASTTPFKAAYLANQDHVRYWIQVSGGDATSMALVRSGLWQADIQALVTHYSQVPAGCGQCAPVTNWEPWNESNNTGWSNPAQYVADVLHPFYDAVETAHPGDTVIGGSSLEVALPWWKGLIAAGGLRYMTVAGVHPYPRNNDAWEEDGIPAQLRQLESLIGKKPLWLTEVGWWGDGDYNYLHQADAVARAMIWQKLLDIPVWNYFIDEGDFDNPADPSFSLIQADDGGNGDDYVKPAALAAMAETQEVADRPVLGRLTTGIPQSYAASFGPVPGGNHRVVALWSDGLATTASLTVSAPAGAKVPVIITNEYGATSSATLTPGMHYALPVSDQVAYVAYPSADTVRLGPTERYGSDLALASSGATATASSGNPSAVLVNPSDATNEGQGWTSKAGDLHPSIRVELAHAKKINRVLVDTQSMGSTATGIRGYTVSVLTTKGKWLVVGTVTRQFRSHIDQVVFNPVDARAVRIQVSTVNAGGYVGGALPSFCTQTSCVVTAFIHAIEIYAGTAAPATVNGANLVRLKQPA
jgi:hypothetical protein